VHTWDETGHFGFRLPICREGDAESHPDSERLERLIEKLRAVGVTALDPKLRDVKWLGYPHWPRLELLVRKKWA
jgi:hypothetical protein